MIFFQFLRTIFFSRPLTITIVSLLFFCAGVLELFSLAMILPVLSQLFNSSQPTGLAGHVMTYAGLVQPSMSSALVFIAVFMSVRGGLILAADLMMAKVARDLEVEVRGKIFGSLLTVGWEYIQSLDLGKLPNLILRETEKYSIAIQKLGQFLSSFLIAGVLVLSSMIASWKLALLFLAAIFPYIFLVRIFNRKISSHAEARIKEANKVSAQTSESLMHIKYIKSSALAGKISERFNQSIKAYAHHFFMVMCCSKFIKNFPEIFGVIIIAVLVYYAHTHMGLQSSDIVFFLLLMFRGYRQISGVQTVLSSLIENIPSYRACNHFLKECAEHKEFYTDKMWQGTNSVKIKIEDVTYAYDSRTEPALKSVNIDFPLTGLVVFAGKSGAGKTTLVDLLLGLIVPKEGGVYIGDNKKLSDVPIAEWRGRIGYVPQEPFLISGSIRDNILLHAVDMPDEDLKEIASMAKMDSFVESLPDAYDTHVGLINTGLSGGQKQRIAIARALAKNPDFFMLDEATSALDPETGRDMRDIIKDISKDKLVIMIAHSIDLIKEADTVYFMEDGQVVESGACADLIERHEGFRNYVSDC